MNICVDGSAIGSRSKDAVIMILMNAMVGTTEAESLTDALQTRAAHVWLKELR